MENLNVEKWLEDGEVLGLELTKRQSYQNQAIMRLGETRLNSYGSMMVIDEYNNPHDIIVRFVESGYMVHTSYQAFSKGEVKNVYDKSVFGIGYIGDGVYKTSENGVSTPQYKTWQGMLRRCYSKKFQEKNPTYIGCTVAEEWHNFQNFAEWYDANYYEVGDQRIHLDKDILVKGNRVYSPSTCCFVPSRLNALFLKRDATRGDLPIGVRLIRGKFHAQCNNGKMKKDLGLHKTPEDAFEAYKTYKEYLIKETAETYKESVPSNLYQAMINYKVEIND